MEVVRIQGDGNCMFRALAHGSHRSHQQVRHEVAEWMNHHWEKDCAPFLSDEERNGYLSRMRRDGTWGGELELSAYHRLTGDTVCVWDASRSLVQSYGNKGDDDAVHLLFHGCHYDRLMPSSFRGATKTRRSRKRRSRKRARSRRSRKRRSRRRIS